MQTEIRNIPQHVAIIMDGNNRWAKQKHLPGLAGHKAGVTSVRQVVEGCVEMGIKVLTLFAFSSENWGRPASEVKGLMDLFMLSLDKEIKKLQKHNVRLRIIGDRSAFSDKLQAKIARAEKLTENNDQLTLNIAANYGGRWDILESTKALIKAAINQEITLDEIDETLFSQFTSLSGVSEPDLCIRTGGEHRISNFLIWHFAYTELYFCDTFWPDFNKAALYEAVCDFSRRQRRFGKTSEQLE